MAVTAPMLMLADAAAKAADPATEVPSGPTLVLGNTIESWITAAIVGGAVFAALYFVKFGLMAWLRNAEETPAVFDDIVRELARKTRFLVIVLIAVAIGATTLAALPHNGSHYLRVVGVLALLLQLALWVNATVNVLSERARKSADSSSVTMINVVGFGVKVGAHSVILLLVLANLGIDVSALIAGMGVGGIAIALATQNLLKDVFASLSIVFDAPFRVGDFIIVGDKMGTVRNIGLKTTRVKALRGEEIVFANAELLAAEIQNLGKLEERRIAFDIGVTYDTPYAKLEKIPQMIEDAITACGGDDQKKARFSRCHFKSFGASSLLYETVYFVPVPDYVAYMDVQQAINLEIVKRFESESIEFAFPTQSIYVHQVAGSPGS